MDIYNRTRRCGSRFRGKDRYTRAQLERLARRFNIPYHGRTMDEICFSLASLPLSITGVTTPAPTPILSTPSYGPYTHTQATQWPYYTVKGRPCSTYGRQPTRLIRDNVEALASHYGIDYRHRTMDDICQKLSVMGV